MDIGEYTVPWQRNMRLGDGYNIERLEIAPSALLDPPAIEPYIERGESGGEYNYEFHIISDEQELHQAIDTAVNATASMPALFSIGVGAKLFRAVRCSETSMTTIYRCTITASERDVVSSADLRPEAEKYLKRRFSKEKPLQKNTKKLLERFGHYYIYSYVSQSSITAISTHTAKSKEQRDKFKLNIAAGYKVASGQWFLNFLKKSKESSLSTHVSVTANGYELSGIHDGLAIHEVSRIFDDFLKRHKPQRQIAILKPLSFIDPQIPRPPAMPLVTLEVKEWWKMGLFLETRAHSHTMIGAQKLVPKISGFTDGIKAIRPYTESKETLEKLRAKLENIKGELDDFDRRFRLLERARGSSKNPWPKDWTEASARASIWSIGYDDSGCILGTSEIYHHQEGFQVVASEDLFGERQVGPVKINLGDRIIVGAKVESLVPSQRNGWWRLKSGEIEGSSIEVEFRTRSHEPGNWALECWSVDRELYAEREPTKK